MMGTLSRFANRLDAALRAVETWLAIACLVIIVVVTALGVFFRYVLNDPLVWSNGAGVLAMMWLTFIGGSLLFKRDEHISIAAVPATLSPQAREVLNTVFSVIVFASAILIAWQMFTLIPLQHKKEIDVLSLPRSAYGTPLLWAMVSISISAFAKIVRAFAGDGTSPPGQQQTIGL